MKTFYKGLIGVTAFVAVSAAIPAMSSALSRDRLVKADRLHQESEISTPGQVAQRAHKANRTGTPYWQTANSIYNADGKTDKENGLTREFGTHIEIDGETARIYGLVDVNYSNYYEIDEEFAVEGVYNERYGTITISGTDYDPERPLSEYNRLANIYSPADDMAYTVVLIAGDCNERGEINTSEELIFDVSDDLSTVRPKKAYGAYAFTSEGEGKAFVDFYQSSSILKAPEEPELKTNAETITFKRQFVAAGMPVIEQFNLMNAGAMDCTFTVSTSSPLLKVSPEKNSLEGCSSVPITVTFSPEEPGIFYGKITIKGAGKTIEVSVNTEVRETPDYTRIVKSGSNKIEFERSPVYPFVLSDENGITVAESINNGEGNGTESWFKCIVDVPDGQSGLFSWKAVQEDRQPNTLAILLDNELVKDEMYRPNTQPYYMSGAIALTKGRHEIVFDNVITMDWSVYGDNQRSYVWDLNFNLMEAKEDNVAIMDENLDFGETYFDKLSVCMESEITVFNTGKNPLRILSIKSDGNFNGTVPDISAPAGGEIKIPLFWTTYKVGDDNGYVIIHTTGGDLKVNCHGRAISLPYDYSSIVSEGELSFNTGREWPFKPNEKGAYAYNTTSMADINGITYSWLEVQFDVPEGKIGHLSWDAKNESENIFNFMDTPSLISGSIFTIDNGNERMVGGLETLWSSSDLYSPIDLSFRPGRHTVKFDYKKTSNEENYIFGKDMLQLFDIALRLNDSSEGEGVLSVSKIDYPDEVLLGTSGHLYATLYNFTSKIPTLVSSECDGPFKAVLLGEQDGNLNLMFEFTPEKEGDYSTDVILKTNIGDYTVKCSGKAKISDFGKAIFYESFEYDFADDWIFIDGGGEDNFWKPMKKVPEMFLKNGLSPYDGKGYMYVSYMDPETNTYYDIVDAYALTSLISIPQNGNTTLRFMLNGKNYTGQTLEILTGESDDPAKFDKVGMITLDSSANGWKQYTFDLTEWAGKKIRLAFHAGQEVGMYFAIDDILVASTGEASVNMVEADNLILTEYYTPEGIRIEKPVKGINIVVTRKTNGTTTSRKMLVK